MPAKAREAPRVSDANRDIDAAAELVLSRITCEEGATRTDILRDLAPFTQHRLSPGEWRARADGAIDLILRKNLVAEHRGRLTLTPEGVQHVGLALGCGESLPKTWIETRNVWLIAKGLGLTDLSPARRKALLHPDGLRTLILQNTYGLAGKKNMPAAKLRAQLALVALERAFGNKIKASFHKGAGLPSKAARTLAGQLADPPRDFPTDAKLIAHLAAQAVGALQTDADALREAILRRLAAPVVDQSARSIGPVCTPQLNPPANDRAPPANGPPPRPGLEDFAAAVLDIGARTAEGWPGNRRAFISAIWEALRTERDAWGLSEIEFKCMLIEAHKRGALVLANADLRSKDRRDEIERSATPDRNTIWHYVRIED